MLEKSENNYNNLKPYKTGLVMMMVVTCGVSDGDGDDDEDYDSNRQNKLSRFSK